jgi:hypothetical protein
VTWERILLLNCFPLHSESTLTERRVVAFFMAISSGSHEVKGFRAGMKNRETQLYFYVGEIQSIIPFF